MEDIRQRFNGRGIRNEDLYGSEPSEEEKQLSQQSMIPQKEKNPWDDDPVIQRGLHISQGPVEMEYVSKNLALDKDIFKQPIEHHLNDKDIGDFGKYRRERDAGIMPWETKEDLMERRARLQSGWSQLFNGLGKGVVTLLTTAVDGTLGMAYGIGSAIANGQFNNVWDNSITTAMKEVNDWSEKVMPNYYTQKELTADSWYDNIFTANFWGDKFIKNLGFTVGAFYSGQIWSKSLSLAGKAFKAMKLGSTAANGATATQRAGRWAKVARTGKEIAGITGYAAAEGSIEAKNGADEWEKAELEKANSEYEIAVNKIQAKYELSDTGEVFNALQEKTSPERARMEEELRQEKKKYEDRIKIIKQDKAKVGNTILALNLPILAASEWIQFGRLHAGGFNPYKSFVRRHAAKRMGNQEYWSLWKKIGIKENRLTDILSVAPKGFFVEAKEEWLQRWASNYAERAYTEDVDSFIKFGKRYNPWESSSRVIGDMADTFAFTWNEHGANGSWEEFWIGGLTGLLGMPRFKRAFKDGVKSAQKTEGKKESGSKLGNKRWGIKFGVENSILQRATEREEKRTFTEKLIKEANERAEAIIKGSKGENDGGSKESAAAYLVNLTQGIDLEKFMEGLNRHKILDAEIAASAAKGDKKGYDIGRAKQLISDIILFNTLGTLDEYKEYALNSLKQNEKYTDEQLKEYIKSMTEVVEVDDGTGNKTKEMRGPYVVEEMGKLKMMEPADVREVLKKNAEDVIKTIDAVRETSDAIQNISLGQLKGDHAEVLTYIAMMRDQYLEESMKSAGELADALEEYVKFWESQKITESGTLTEQEQKNVQRFNNYVDSVLKKISALRDYAADVRSESPSSRKLAKAKRILIGTLGSSEYRMGLLTSEQVGAVLKAPVVKEAFESHLKDLFDSATDAARFIKYAEEFQEKFTQYMADVNKLDVDIEKINQEEAKKRTQQQAKSVSDSIIEKWNAADEEAKKTKKKSTYTFAQFRKDAGDTDVAEMQKHFKDNPTLLNYANNLAQFRRVKDKAKEIMDKEGVDTPIRDIVDRVLEDTEVEGNNQKYLNKLKNTYKSTHSSVMNEITASTEDKVELGKQSSDIIKKVIDSIEAENKEKKKAQQKQSAGNPVNPGGNPVNPVSTSISSAIAKLLEGFNGKTFDIRSIQSTMAGYDDSTLKKYKETLGKVTDTDKQGLTDLEIAYKDILSGAIDAILREREEKAEQLEIDEKKEKEKKKAIEKEYEEENVDRSIDKGTLRSHDLSYYDAEVGKNSHQKVPNKDRTDVADVMDATKAQELIDSGILGHIFNLLTLKNKKLPIKIMTSESYQEDFVLALDIADLQKIFKSASMQGDFSTIYSMLVDNGYIQKTKVDGKEVEFAVVGNLGVVGYGDKRWITGGLQERWEAADYKAVGNMVKNSKSKTNVSIPIKGKQVAFTMHNDVVLEVLDFYSGRFEKSDKEQDLQNLKPVGENFTFGVVLSDGSILGPAAGTPLNPHNRNAGMVIVTTRGADGRDYPIPITVKHFSKSEFPVNDDTNALTKKVKEVVKAIVQAGDNKDVNEALKHIRALRKLLYFGDYELHFDIVSPRVVKGKLEYGIVFKMKTPTGIETISQVGSETKEDALFRSLVDHDFRIYVHGMDEGTMKFNELLEAGAFSTNVASLRNFNGSFTLNIPGKAPVKPASNPGPGKPSGKAPVIKWKGYTIRPDGDVVDAKGNIMSKSDLNATHPELGITYAEVFNILRNVMDSSKKHEEYTDAKGQDVIVYSKTNRSSKTLFKVYKKNGQWQIETLNQADYEKLKKEDEENKKKTAPGKVPVNPNPAPQPESNPQPNPSQQSQVDKDLIDNLNNVVNKLTEFSEKTITDDNIDHIFNDIFNALEAMGFDRNSSLVKNLMEMLRDNRNCLKFDESRQQVKDFLSTIAEAFEDDTKQHEYRGISLNIRNLKDAQQMNLAATQLTNSLKCFS